MRSNPFLMGLIHLLVLSQTALAEPRLAPESRWRDVAKAGVFLSAPRWLPDGSGFVASGGRGKGLHLWREGVGWTTLDPAFRGRTFWDGDGVTLCLEGHRQLMAWDIRTGQRSDRPCRPRAVDEVDGELLFEGPGHRLLFNHYVGTIKRVGAEGTEEVVARGAPWGVAIEPGGRRLAYAQGHLPRAELVVIDLEGGRTDLGRGVHPAWLPGRIIYAVPGRTKPLGGFTALEEGELFLYDTRTGVTVQLTHTPERAEMEPQVSPSGDAILFADWSRGVITVAPLLKGGER